MVTPACCTDVLDAGPLRQRAKLLAEVPAIGPLRFWAMWYVEAPGRFDPCVPYTPGDKAWGASRAGPTGVLRNMGLIFAGPYPRRKSCVLIH
jgi:hypothetical protein